MRTHIYCDKNVHAVFIIFDKRALCSLVLSVYNSKLRAIFSDTLFSSS